MTTLHLRNSINRASLRLRFFLIPLALACFACSPTARSELPSVPLGQHFLADDATYEVSLPDGWQKIGQATWDYGLFFGPHDQAESFAVGTPLVFTNQKMLNAQKDADSILLSRSQQVLKSRLLAQPMSPLDVVTKLLPQLAGGPQGAIQNPHVRYTIPANMGSGYNGMLVVYDYILMPGRDPPYAELAAHPVLHSQPQVPMQAAAFIVTYPYTGPDNWTFGYLILSAPQSVFQRKQATYAGIFNSFQLIPQGLVVKVHSNEGAAEMAESMKATTQKVAQDWWRELGPATGTTYKDTGKTGPEIGRCAHCVDECWVCGDGPPDCYPNGPPPDQNCRRLMIHP